MKLFLASGSDSMCAILISQIELIRENIDSETEAYSYEGGNNANYIFGLLSFDNKKIWFNTIKFILVILILNQLMLDDVKDGDIQTGLIAGATLAPSCKYISWNRYIDSKQTNSMYVQIYIFFEFLSVLMLCGGVQITLFD